MDINPSPSPERTRDFGMGQTPSPSPEPKRGFGMDQTPSPSPEPMHDFGMGHTPSPSPEPKHDFGMAHTPSQSPSPEPKRDFGMAHTPSPSPEPHTSADYAGEPTGSSSRTHSEFYIAKSYICILLFPMQIGSGESGHHLPCTSSGEADLAQLQKLRVLMNRFVCYNYSYADAVADY